jgi:very-short-patch-repair endonuclease
VNVERLLRESRNRAATWTELRPFVSQHELAAAIGRGRVVHDGSGTYRLASTPIRYGHATRVRGTLSHLSAAQHWHLPTLADVTETHVTVDPNRSRLKVQSGVRIYYRRIPDEHVVGGVTSVIRTLLDCAQDLPLPDALSVLDGALIRKDVKKQDLVDAAELLRGIHATKVQRIVGWADERAASPMESALRGVLLDAGITSFEPQFPVKISTGAILHADLGDPESRILIEADSVLAHGGRAAFERDAWRYDEFIAAGYRLLRFTWRQIMERRPWVVDMARRTLEFQAP